MSIAIGTDSFGIVSCADRKMLADLGVDVQTDQPPRSTERPES
ncbi:hypothetical protein [Amycolatopsis japonica]